MNAWQNLLDRPETQRLGWTLVHSVWQGAAIAIVLGIALKVLANRSSQSRYVASCAALALALIASVSTYFLLGPVIASVRVSSPQFDPIAPMVASETVAVAPRLQPLSKPAAVAPRFLETSTRYAVIAWIVGVLVLSLRQIGGWIQLQRYRKSGKHSIEATWKLSLENLSARMGIARVVRLMESASVLSPSLIGMIRPVILVPVGIFSELTPAQVQAILAHELAHVRRHDYLANLLQIVIETLLFYHPAIWWISSRVRQERENCCDDMAVAICADRVVYADALTRVAEIRRDSLMLAAGGGTLADRVYRLLGIRQSRRRIGSIAAAVIAILCVLAPIFTLKSFAAPSHATPAAAPTKAAPTTSEMKFIPITPEDLVVEVKDYRIGPSDLLSVSIHDLVGAGIESVKTCRVSDTGSISLPLLGQTKAAGMTEAELEKSIAKAYGDAHLIQNANVSVTVSEARQRRFVILGGVSRPGEYAITKPDFRVLDALTMSGGNPNKSAKIVVIRSGDKEKGALDIPADKLVAGDTKVNVVIRPSDMIVVSGPERTIVRIVVGETGIQYKGAPSDWDRIEKVVSEIPQADRGGTVIELAADSGQLPIGKYLEAQARALRLMNKFGLLSVSNTGVDPGTRGSTTSKVQRTEAPKVTSDEPPEMNKKLITITSELSEESVPEAIEQPARTQQKPTGEQRMYYVGGDIRRVGTYSLTSKITLRQAIVAAGMWETKSIPHYATVIRREANGTESYPLRDEPIDDALKNPALAMYVMPNDVVMMTSNARAEDLKRERDRLQTALDSLRQSLGENHVNVVAVREAVRRLDAQIAATKGPTTAPSTQRGDASTSHVNELIHMRDNLSQRLSILQQFGYLDQHPTVASARAAIAVLNGSIHDLERELSTGHPATSQGT